MYTRGRRGVRVPKKLDWTGAQLRFASVGATKASAYVVDPSLLKDLFTSPTLMMTRCYSRVRNLSAPAAAGGFAAFGLIEWNDLDDVAPAPGDTPGVLSNIDLDWIYRLVQPYAAGTPLGNDSGGAFSDNTHVSKARRKLENTSGLLCCVETVDITASFAIDFRVLLKQV